MTLLCPRLYLAERSVSARGDGDALLREIRDYTVTIAIGYLPDILAWKLG